MDSVDSNSDKSAQSESDREPESSRISLFGSWVIILWLGACFLWLIVSTAGLSVLGDMGGIGEEKYVSLLFLDLAGQLLVAVAGVFAGLGCIWQHKRMRMFITFGLLLTLGVAAQAFVILEFSKHAFQQ